MSSKAGRSGYSRREFVSIVAAAPLVSAAALQKRVMPLGVSAAPLDGIRVASPDGRVVFELVVQDAHLGFRTTFGGHAVVESSPIGISVDSVDLGQGIEVGPIESYRIDAKYPWRGGHAQARNTCRGAKINLTHAASATKYVLEVRAFDDGIAFRCIIPGAGVRTPDESTTFVLPAASTVWYHDLRGHYEASYSRKEISEVQAGDWAAPPVTIKLPGGAGYASLTEGALINYAGMVLQADGQRGFRVRLGHAHPASYPFTLRYGEAEAARLAKPAAIAGAITTPWRVVMLGSDLNALVNCDIVHNVSPPPDRRLFARGFDTDWLKPGRAVWKYLDGGGENSLETMKEFSRLAGELGFEYNLVEGFWQRWPEKDLRELIEYSKQRNVGIWLWKHTRDLRDAAARETFFTHVQNVGAVGVKMDFLDHEAKEVMDLYQDLLRGAAEHRLMVNFHGANKPTGESRTWPNEMTREAVSGMERRSMQAWSAHNTTIPFARMLAGHLDFTAMLFGERRRETSWAHQIATAALFTSPLLVYGAHPRAILENPAVEVIKSVPSVWDETRVLPDSEIGELAVFARRRGKQWFLIVANGPTARSIRVPLSFLGRGKRQALLVRDDADNAAAVRIERVTMRRSDSIDIALREGGGFIASFS